jgi:hypothetical protein
MKQYFLEMCVGLFFAITIFAAASGFSFEVPFIYQGF